MTKVGDVGLPLGTVTDQVIAGAGEFVLTNDARRRVAAFQTQPHGVIGVTIGHAEHRIAIAQKNRVPAAARQEVDNIIGLSEILFECQR